MINKSEIPKDWEVVKISKVGSLLRGVSYKKDDASKFPKENFLPILRANNINIDLNFDDLIYVPKKYVDEFQLIQSGDIIFAMSSGSKHLVGKSAKAKADFDGSYGAFCGLFRTSENANKGFVAYFFQSPFYKKVVSEVSKGTNINNLKREHILNLDLPLPPLAEQERIVAKIEELFSELDAGLESLKQARQQLKIYRQAVLKSAFEGKLTNDNLNSSELPNGWKWKKSGELFSFVTSGSRGWAKYYSDKGAIFVRITNLNFDTLGLDLRESKIQYVNPPENSEGLRTKVQEGDFLFSITGYLGMFAIAPKLENAFVNQHIALCRPKENFNKKYVGYWIISKSGGIHYLNLLRKGAVKAGLGLDDIKNFPVPLCSLEEQQRVVQEIESRLSVCDKLEETIHTNLKQAEALRQSILKKAFEGRLVKAKAVEKPKRTAFYQMQTLGLIVNRSKQKHIRHGEMTLAKYAFLADKIYGVPIYDRYERWHLGPYPTEIKKTVNNKQFFKTENNTIRVLNEEKLFKYHNEYQEQIENAVDELAEIFSSFDAKDRSHKTELLATVCKVVEDVQTTEIQVVRQSMAEWKIDLKDKKFKNKAKKFDETETVKCLAFIVKNGWDKKLIKCNPEIYE